MNFGTRHPAAPRRSLSAFASMSVMALLALACFPVAVQADSSGVQYSDDLPGLPPEKTPSKQKQPPAKSSVSNNGGATVEKEGKAGSKGVMDDSSEGDDSSKEGGVAAGADDRGNGQGSPGGSVNTKDNALVQPGAQAPSETTADDDGSSPLVPILIAILALAAISVAAVMIRQRRQRGGTAGAAPSPKAS